MAAKSYRGPIPEIYHDRIAEDYRNGVSFGATARWLTEQGVTTNSGKPIDSAVVCYLVQRLGIWQRKVHRNTQQEDSTNPPLAAQ